MALFALVTAVTTVAIFFSTNSPALRSIVSWRRGIRVAHRHEVIFQLYGYDCGPAAIANLLSLAGKSYDLLKIEREAKPTAIGTSISMVASVLTRNGLTARIAFYERRDIKIVPRPSIVLLHHHYVVIADRLGKGRLEIMDPFLGDMSESSSALSRQWSGWAVLPVKEKKGKSK